MLSVEFLVFTVVVHGKQHTPHSTAATTHPEQWAERVGMGIYTAKDTE
jgi:hypothetical protein